MAGNNTFEYLIKAVADVTGLKLTEEEQAKVIALTEQQAAASREAAVAEDARAAASERGILASARLHHVYEALGSSLGLGGLLAEAFVLYELVERISRFSEEHAEKIKKEKEEQQKFNEELLKEADAMERIKSLDDLDSKRAAVLEKIADLSQQRVAAQGDEYRILTQQIAAQEQIVGQMDRMVPLVIARQRAEEQSREALHGQMQEVENINRAYAEQQRAADQKLRTLEKIEEINAGAEIAAVNRQERDGQISHEEAERQRTGIQNRAEQKKFDEEQAANSEKIARLQKDVADDQAKAAQRKKEADEAADKLIAAAGAVASGGSGAASAAQADAEAKRHRADELAKAGDTTYVGGPYGGLAPQYDPDKAKAIADAEAKAKAAEARAAELNAHAGEVDAQFQMAKEDYEKKVALARKEKEDADKAAADNAQKIAEAQSEAADAAQEHSAKVAAQSPEDSDKVEQGRIHDQKEREEQQKKIEDQLVQKIHSQAESAEGSKDLGQMNRLDQAIKDLIHSNSGLGEATVQKLTGIAERVEQHEKEIQELHQRVKGIPGGH